MYGNMSGIYTYMCMDICKDMNVYVWIYVGNIHLHVW